MSLTGYGGPNPQPLRRTWGCSCWDGRGWVNTRLAADPVNTATGALMETFTDASIAGLGRHLDWGRTYNSLDPTDGPLGQGWTFSYNVTLTPGPDRTFMVRDGTGGQTQYRRDGDGSYHAVDSGVTATLTDRSGGGWLLRSYNDTTHLAGAATGPMTTAGGGAFGAMLHLLANGFTKGILFLSAANLHRAEWAS